MTTDYIDYRKKVYAEDLETEAWQLKRAEIIKRDCGQCRNCGSSEALQVHHRQYHIDKRNGNWQQPYLYANKYLITLCEACHKKGHATYTVPKYYI